MIPTVDLKNSFELSRNSILTRKHDDGWYMMIRDDFWWFILFMMICDALWLIRMIYDELCDLLILNGDFTELR